jgi:hypothetical protein
MAETLTHVIEIRDCYHAKSFRHLFSHRVAITTSHDTMADERPLDGRYFPIILRNRERTDEIEATRVAGESVEQGGARSADPVNGESTRDRSPSAESSEDESGEEDANAEDSEDEAAVNSDDNESGNEIAGRPRGILRSPSLSSEDGWGGDDTSQVESESRGTILPSIEGGGGEPFDFEEAEARAIELRRAYWSPPREDRTDWSDDESQDGEEDTDKVNKGDDLEAATEPTRPGGDLGH